MAIDFSNVANSGGNRLAVSTKNSIVKVKQNQPNALRVIYHLTANADINIDDVTIDIDSDVDVYIEKGTYLYFGYQYVIAAESKTILTTGSILAIQASKVTILTGEVCSTYALITLPSTDIPNDEALNKVDAKTHRHGELSASERVGRRFSPTIPLVVSQGDIGYFDHIVPAALNKKGYDGSVNAAIAIPISREDYSYTFGVALVSVDEDLNATDNIRKPSVTLSFEQPWFKVSSYLSEPKNIRKYIIDSCRLAGLKINATELFVDKESVVSGETFTITFVTSDPGSYGYTITGVNSADINGEPLTGTFNGASATLTFTLPVPTEAKPEKEFKISLDNNAASTTVTIAAFVPFYTLQTDLDSLAIGQTATITFNTNLPGNYDYIITGVNSADIDNTSLTGTFTANGETLTLTSTAGEAKTLTLALDNGEATTAIGLLEPIYELTTSREVVSNDESFTITFATNSVLTTPYTITGVTTGDINNTPLTGSFNNGSTRTFSFVGTVDKTFTLSLDNGKADISVTLLIKTFYCPQTIPDYDIPGLGAQPPQQDTDYCPQDTTGFFDIDYVVTTQTQTDTDYCPQDTTGFYTINIPTSIVDYCQQVISHDWETPDRVAFTATTVDYCQQSVDSTWGVPTRTTPLGVSVDYCQQVIDPNWEIQV